jgi:hypothetical protein
MDLPVSSAVTQRHDQLANAKMMTRNRGLQLILAMGLWHGGEHLLETYQLSGSGYPHAQALGSLSTLVFNSSTSNWLMVAHTLVMLASVGLLQQVVVMKRHGLWWEAMWLLQIWHVSEHILLVIQSLIGASPFSELEFKPLNDRSSPHPMLHLMITAVTMGLFLHFNFRRSRSPSEHERYSSP